MPNAVTPIQASTQDHVDILDILDDITINKDGSCSIVLQVTAINFDLLSEMEQDAIIYAYAGLLNSLTFSIQIMIRSAIKDVTNYINLIKEQEQKQKKQLLLDQLKQYRIFVENLVKDNRVLDKKFYVVIPFTSLELGLTPTLAASFSKTQKLPYPKGYILERAKMNLYPKRDHIVRQFGRLGLQCHQLNTQQVIELFYGMYNEESVGQRLGTSREYSIPIVTTKPSTTPKETKPMFNQINTQTPSPTPKTNMPQGILTSQKQPVPIPIQTAVPMTTSMPTQPQAPKVVYTNKTQSSSAQYAK